MSKTIQLDQFIARAKQRQADKMKLSTIHVDWYGGEIQLVSLGITKVSEMLDAADSATVSGNLAFNKELIYASMPILKNKELQEQFDLSEPDEIVLEVFSLDEINKIGEKILAFNGMDMGVDEVKN